MRRPDWVDLVVAKLQIKLCRLRVERAAMGQLQTAKAAVTAAFWKNFANQALQAGLG
jgi:hypothetical protein